MNINIKIKTARIELSVNLKANFSITLFFKSYKKLTLNATFVGLENFT